MAEVSQGQLAVAQKEANVKVGELGVHQQQARIQQQDADTRRLSYENEVFKAQEAKRHNLTNEYYSGVSARQQTRSLDQKDVELSQKDRSLNQQDRSLSQQDQALALRAYEATTGRQNVSLGYANLNELARHNQANEQLIPSQIVQNYGTAGRNISSALNAGLGITAAVTSGSLLRGAVRAVTKHPVVALGTAGVAALATLKYNQYKSGKVNMEVD